MAQQPLKPATVTVDANWYEWLKFFYGNADFGPAHEDVEDSIRTDFTKETGIVLPGWDEE
jgi:hypothetical protein